MIHTVYLVDSVSYLTKNLGRVLVASLALEPWLTVAQARFCKATIGLNRQHKQGTVIDASATPHDLCWSVMTSAEVVSVLDPLDEAQIDEHDTLKYHLLGPSLTKAGQNSVDQQKAAFSKARLTLALS